MEGSKRVRAWAAGKANEKLRERRPEVACTSTSTCQIRDSIVVSISACHAEDPGARVGVTGPLVGGRGCAYFGGGSDRVDCGKMSAPRFSFGFLYFPISVIPVILRFFL